MTSTHHNFLQSSEPTAGNMFVAGVCRQNNQHVCWNACVDRCKRSRPASGGLVWSRISEHNGIHRRLQTATAFGLGSRGRRPPRTAGTCAEGGIPISHPRRNTDTITFICRGGLRTFNSLRRQSSTRIYSSQFLFYL